LSATMKRGTGLSQGREAFGESRGRAPKGERVFRKGGARRMRAKTSGAPLVRACGIYPLRLSALRLPPFGRGEACLAPTWGPFVDSLPHASGANKTRRENENLFSAPAIAGEGDHLKLAQRAKGGGGGL
jgi:hypothetical protein